MASGCSMLFDFAFDFRQADDLIEYAMGSDPTVFNASGDQGNQLEVGEFVTFSFRKNPLAEDVTFMHEQSSNAPEIG
jgi:hypothetical protein